MQTAGPQSLQGLAVSPSAVSLVAPQFIAGEQLIQRDHPAIAGHLGNDRGGGNRETGTISLDDGLLRGGTFETQRIDQEMVGSHGQSGQRLVHGAARGGDDADAIDHLGRTTTDPKAERLFDDGVVAAFPLWGRYQFAITDLGQWTITTTVQWQNNGRGNHGASPGATTGFIETSYHPMSRCPQPLFLIKRGSLAQGGCLQSVATG